MAGRTPRQQERLSRRPLHNFTFPEWGYQQSTNGNNNTNSTSRSNTTTHCADNRNSPISGSSGEVFPEKLMTNYCMATDRLKLTIRDGKRKNHNDNNMNNEKETSEEDKDSKSLRPSNLRTRSKGPTDAGGVIGNNKLLPIKIMDRAESKEGNNGKRPKFSLSLIKEEIEKDFLEMTGAKPPRRPKKVQRQLNVVFPGLWLTEITPETYKVEENGEQGRKKNMVKLTK